MHSAGVASQASLSKIGQASVTRPKITNQNLQKLNGIKTAFSNVGTKGTAWNIRFTIQANRVGVKGTTWGMILGLHVVIGRTNGGIIFLEETLNEPRWILASHTAAASAAGASGVDFPFPLPFGLGFGLFG